MTFMCTSDFMWTVYLWHQPSFVWLMSHEVWEWSHSPRFPGFFFIFHILTLLLSFKQASFSLYSTKKKYHKKSQGRLAIIKKVHLRCKWKTHRNLNGICNQHFKLNELLDSFFWSKTFSDICVPIISNSACGKVGSFSIPGKSIRYIWWSSQLFFPSWQAF